MSLRFRDLLVGPAVALAALVIALLALVVSLIGLTRSNDRPVADPPIVLQGKGFLQCSISSTSNGVQELTIVSGAGPALKATVAPIRDGIVEFASDGSAEYKFSTSLVEPTKMTIEGLGSGTLESMEIEVKIRVSKVDQPGGDGKEFTFGPDALSDQSQYLEILGDFRLDDGGRYSLRVALDDISDGSGSVVPSGPGRTASLLSKEVTLGSEAAPATIITTLVELR